MPPCGLMVGRMTRRTTEEWGGELQSRPKGSSYQELAEERKIEGGVVDCDATGSCVWTLGPHLGVLFWENFKR